MDGPFTEISFHVEEYCTYFVNVTLILLHVSRLLEIFEDYRPGRSSSDHRLRIPGALYSTRTGQKSSGAQSKDFWNFAGGFFLWRIDSPFYHGLGSGESIMS